MTLFLNRKKNVWVGCSLLLFIFAAVLAGQGVFAAERNSVGNYCLLNDGGKGLDMSVFLPEPSPRKVAMSFLPASGKLESISVSAWIRPTQYEAYNEIFRQESDNRILFSLQENATLLSLGLNIDGYLECDAAIQRDVLFDGDWHHVAGTFDGQFMRVYFDGREIQRLERPGVVRVKKQPDGFVGSSGGHGEFFYGDMSDLQLGLKAETPENIRQKYQAGMNFLEKKNEAVEKNVQKYYAKQSDFLSTLLALKDAFAQTPETLTKDLSIGISRRMKTDFPDDYSEFAELTGVSPLALLASPDLTELTGKMNLLMGQMLEYKPITPEQWENVSPEMKEHWRHVEQLVGMCEKMEPQLDKPTLETFLALFRKAKESITERPAVREPVAPYLPPETPQPRNVSAENAERMIQQDWLFQCDDAPNVERIMQEIDWGIRLAERLKNDSATMEKVDRPFLNRAIQQLQELRSQTGAILANRPMQNSECHSIYFQVRDIKRQIQFSNPLLDFDEILFVDMPYPGGSEWQHETRHRLGYMAVPGAQLLVLNGLKPDGVPRRLLPQGPLHGSFWRPDLSFDATRVLVSFKPHNEKSFHIYEINLDGTGMRQITAGMFDDLDPVYLPDGKNFVFSTSRSYTYVRCMPPTNAFVLARCALDGEDVYLISQNNEPDYLPSILNDGRIIYTRWEYTDKPLWRCQSLWTANPDGTQHNTFWGNQSVWPDLPKDVRSIPGSSKVMFTGSAHHDWFAGSVGIIDPDKGLNFPAGLTKVTADVAWPECGNGPVDPIESQEYHASGKFNAYYSPYPLSEKDFLVSASKNGKFSLYLMDVDGNRELIYEGNNNIFHAIPVRKREVPPVLVDRTEWPTKEERANPKGGVLYSGNVYEGAPSELSGKARYLRILNIEPKTYTLWDQRPYISTGPVVSMVQSEGVKRILGTVPVEKDGSICFEVPAGVALHFQLLDENHQTLQTMRSFTGVMPGEARGCLGCHERHSGTPEAVFSPKYIATNQPPRQIKPVPWAFDPNYEVDPNLSIEEAINQAMKDFASSDMQRDDIWKSARIQVARQGTSISYDKDIKPVLKRYCAECHTGDAEGTKTFDMTPRPGFLMFDEPYVTIIGAPNWGAPGTHPTGAWGGGNVDTNRETPPGFGIAATIPVEAYDQRDPAAYATPEPMKALSYASPLVKMASSGEHYDVKMDPVSLLKVILWIDAMCPYIDDTQIKEVPDPVFQGSDWLSIKPRMKTAPTIVRPGPFSAKQDDTAYEVCPVPVH